MAGYARRFPDRQVLFVALPIDVSHGVRTGHREALAQAQRPVLPVRIEGFTNLYTVRPIKWLPDSFPGGRRFNQCIARAQVRRVARQLHLQHPLLWIKPYWGAHFAGRMGECAVLYDVGDDWTTIPQSARAMRWAMREDQWLTRHADVVLVVSEDLYRKKRALRNEVFLVPNGVDASRFAAIWHRTLPPHPITSGWQRPVLGYTGMLHAERLDVELTIAVARRMPQATLALVGPNLLDATQTARLTAEPGIRLTGSVPHAELPRVMTTFDVCIAPNRINAFSESQNPLKLWEYLASGLPVVATPVSGFRDYPELVYLASTPEAFVAKIHAALRETPDLSTRRQQAVSEQTWDARLDTIQQIVRRVVVEPNTP